jgi:hypothetical protein
VFSTLNRLLRQHSTPMAARSEPTGAAARHASSGPDDGPLQPRGNGRAEGAEDLQASVSPVRARLPAVGPAAAEAANDAPTRPDGDNRPTTELYTRGPIPPRGPLRWAHLAVAAHWQPERLKLHDRLIGEATSGALKFAEAVERAQLPPTLFALRGNTAAGKTYMAKKSHPVLADALKASGGAGVINPDAFKPALRDHSGPTRPSSERVHGESCVLADRLEEELKPMKTPSGAPASMLVDKRLAQPGEIGAYLEMAEQTGRKMELCDIDAPLERSLAGVLMRTPEGDDPVPPYLAIAHGFTGVRGNRLDVIDKLLDKPDLGNYQLFGTTEDGSKVKVASVENGELCIHEPQLYERITAPESAAVGFVGDRVIDAALIERLAGGIDDPQRAAGLRAALQRYEGMTWAQAVDAHCARSK